MQCRRAHRGTGVRSTPGTLENRDHKKGEELNGKGRGDGAQQKNGIISGGLHLDTSADGGEE